MDSCVSTLERDAMKVIVKQQNDQVMNVYIILTKKSIYPIHLLM